MEAKRQLDVLDNQLANNKFIVGENIIADMAIRSWYGNLALGKHDDDSSPIRTSNDNHVISQP